MDALKPAQCYGTPGVYFVGCEQSAVVKIGKAVNIKKRLASLQTGCPFQLNVFAVIPPATARNERRFHERFSSERIRGEWFRLSDRLRRFVAKQNTLLLEQADVIRAAAQLGVSINIIIAWIRSGELSAVNCAAKPNGQPRWQLTQEDIDAFLEGRRNQVPVTAVRRSKPRKMVHAKEYF